MDVIVTHALTHRMIKLVFVPVMTRGLKSQEREKKINVRMPQISLTNYMRLANPLYSMGSIF